MTFSLVQTNTAQGNALVNGTVISYYGCFTDHNTAAMVNQNTVTKLCARMNLDQCEKAGNLRDQTRNKKHVMFIKPMHKPVPDQSVHTLVKQKYLQGTPRCRVTFLYCFHIGPDIF